MSIKSFLTSVSQMFHSYPLLAVVIVIGFGLSIFIMCDAHNHKKDRARHRWK